MKRTAFLLTAFAVIGLSAPAFANDPAPAPAATIKDFKLPSQAEIDQMLEKMPDFNGIMGDMMELAKDEKMQEQFSSAAEGFKELLDDEALTKRDENGLPDINGLLATMLGAMSDEGPASELLEGMTDITREMENIMEKHAAK